MTCSSMFAPIRAFAITPAFWQPPLPPSQSCSAPRGCCGLAHAHCEKNGLLFLERSQGIFPPWTPLTGPLARNIRCKETGKPSDKHINKPFKKSNIPSKRTIDSTTAKSSTTGLSTRPIAVAATRFRPLSESRPPHCRNTFPDDETTTMLFYDHGVDTPSVGSAFFVWPRKARELLVENCTFHLENCTLLVVKVRVSCNMFCGTTPSVAGFLGALRGVGGRLSQFCGSRAHFVSTMILSREQ